MAANPVLLGKIASVLGGCVGLPYLLWKVDSFGGGTSESKVVKTSDESTPESGVNLPKVQNPHLEKGNCKVQDISAESRSFLSSQKKNEKLYVELSCEGTHVRTPKTPKPTNAYGSWPQEWTGLFPSNLIADNDKLAVGKKFDINTDTTSTKEANKKATNKTSFSGKGMKSPVEGEWGEKIQGEKYSAIPVPITKSATKDAEIIYLILD